MRTKILVLSLGLLSIPIGQALANVLQDIVHCCMQDGNWACCLVWDIWRQMGW